ncbi:unnamed protein product [Heterosigma akashiwo]
MVVRCTCSVVIVMVSFSGLRTSDYLTEGQALLGADAKTSLVMKRDCGCLLLRLELAANAASAAASSSGGTGPVVRRPALVQRSMLGAAQAVGHGSALLAAGLLAGSVCGGEGWCRAFTCSPLCPVAQRQKRGGALEWRASCRGLYDLCFGLGLIWEGRSGENIFVTW